MNREKALKTLRHYNKWRRDNHIPNNIPMPDPKEVGEAIDVAIRALRMCRALDRVVECYDDLNRVANENRPY